jgi:hypothetical protein
MEILQHDQQYRNQGITGDLVSLSSLSMDSSWSLTCPTLVNDRERPKLERSLSVFFERFRKEVPLMDPSFLDLSNLAIAGGCVKSLLLNRPIKDVDVFIYGLTPEQAVDRVNKFILDIYRICESMKTGEYLKKKAGLSDETMSILQKKASLRTKEEAEAVRSIISQYSDCYFPPPEGGYYRRTRRHGGGGGGGSDDSDSFSFQIINGGHSLSLIIEHAQISFKPIQIILRCYKTMSEIIHGFDLGSSAMCFDGNEVYLTGLGKYCLENMVNIFDHTRRSTTYEKRLIKNFDDGFQIVLPNLDLAKLRKDYFRYQLSEVCELPYLTFAYSHISDFAISVVRYYAVGKASDVKLDKVTSDYSYADLLDDKFVMANYNLQQLLNGQEKYVHVIDLYENKKNYSDEASFLANWRLGFTGTSIKWYDVERFYEKQFKNLTDMKVDVRLLLKNFSAELLPHPEQFIKTVYLDKTTEHQRRQLIGQLISKQKNLLRTKLQELASPEHPSRKLLWITETPMTQLTSSINPILESVQEWYGVYYTEHPTPFMSAVTDKRSHRSGRRGKSTRESEYQQHGGSYEQVPVLDEDEDEDDADDA